MSGARRILGKLYPLFGLGLLGLTLLAVVTVQNRERAGRAATEARRQLLDARIRSLELDESFLDRTAERAPLVRVTVGAGGYRKPAPAAEGGYDVEPNLQKASVRLVDRLLSGSRQVEVGDLVARTIRLRPVDGSSNADRELGLRVAALLRRRGIPAIQDDDGNGGLTDLLVSDRQMDGFGRVLELREAVAGHRSWSVLIDPEMKLARMPLRNEKDEQRLDFRTDHQTRADFARDDAVEGLRLRLGNLVWSIAHDLYEVDARDEARFRTIMEERCPTSLLIDLGRREVGIVRKLLEAPEGDQTFYQADVSWVADRAVLRRAAETVRDHMVARSREPWIRAGLVLGVLVLAVMGWLKVDWWLKGRHAFLSKAAFAMLALLGIAASMGVSLHG
ncbi:MAG: hypothetical protein H6807_10895 [Planctomycetes bacterium]|nr:hypothetical protein [Planctomycetota bacterium]